MGRGGWHILREGDRLTVARRLPARLDFAATAVFPDVGRLRLAMQIRQDMWRALQRLRGFNPVVEVTRRVDGLAVRAGGGLPNGSVPVFVTARVAEILSDDATRARWIRCAC